MPVVQVRGQVLKKTGEVRNMHDFFFLIFSAVLSKIVLWDQLSVVVLAHNYSSLSALSVSICFILIISCYAPLFHTY